jgi:hypothetical protein
LLHKNNHNNKGGQLLDVLRIHISVALQQKTANFKVTIGSRAMQWSALTEERKRINLLHEHDDENKCGVYW